jgi:hypothetical protein
MRSGLLPGGGAELGLGGGAGGVDVGGPSGDEGGVGAGFEGGAVAGQALVAVRDDPFGLGGAGEEFLGPNQSRFQFVGIHQRGLLIFRYLHC